LAFTDGLDRWQLGGTFLRQGTGLDYSATAEDGRAILAAAVPEPAGFAFLAQDIEPDDYRGRTVTFRGELRTAQAGGRAGLALRAASPGRPTPPQAASPDPWEDPANHIAFAPVSPDDQRSLAGSRRDDRHGQPGGARVPGR
jgi:hypothetical protein